MVYGVGAGWSERKLLDEASAVLLTVLRAGQREAHACEEVREPAVGQADLGYSVECQPSQS